MMRQFFFLLGVPLLLWSTCVESLPSRLGILQQFRRDRAIETELSKLQSSLEAYAEFHGFRLNSVNITTKDNVRLTIHRVRQMDIFSEEESIPVILSHGFAASSFDYMANARNESLAFLLADRGYDVWAINYRGNILCGPASGTAGPEYYYRATWQYMAEYDLPALIDHVLKVRSGRKFHIIGQSMGTTAVFAMLAENHSYDDKIITFHALTPVSLLGDDAAEGLQRMFNESRSLPSYLHTPLEFRLAYGMGILNKKGPLSHILFSNKLCLISTTFCNGLTGILFDREKNSDNPHIRRERFPLYFSKYPAGATMANMYLFSTQFGRDLWSKANYDHLKLPGLTNRKEYGQDDPPQYDFTKLNVNLSLYYTENDVFTGVNTAKEFASRMSKQLIPGGMHMINGNRLSHQDALWAWDARCYMYDDVMKEMESIESYSDSYRKEVQRHLSKLDFEDGCRGLPS